MEAEKYGEVRDVYIPKDFHTKRPKGLAFVEFQDPIACEDALEGLEGLEMEGQQVCSCFSFPWFVAPLTRNTIEEYRTMLPSHASECFHNTFTYVLLAGGRYCQQACKEGLLGSEFILIAVKIECRYFCKECSSSPCPPMLLVLVFFTVVRQSNWYWSTCLGTSVLAVH